MKKRIRWLLIALIILVAVLLWFRRCPIRYEEIHLPTEIRFIQDINDSGTVVGGGIGSNINHAFVWSEAEGLKDLGTFGFARATADDINNAGQILIRVGDPNDRVYGLLYDPKTGTTNLGSIGGGEAETVGRAMNENGQVVGLSYTASGASHAFYWDQASGMTDLGTLGGRHSQAYDISESGQVVGVSDTGTVAGWHAFIWTADAGMIDLTPSPALATKAGSINSKGIIVGTMTDSSGNYFGSVWDANIGGGPGTGKPSSGILLQVNDSGQYLGYTQQRRLFDESINKFFIEDPQKGRVYLDRFIKTKGWRILWPVMNNHGWIVGKITDIDGYQHRPVLLKPIKK